MTATPKLKGLMLIAFALYFIVVLRGFCEHIDQYPYLSVDDGLANISYVLAEHHRSAFFSMPFMSNWTARVDGVHNYGPWYFWLGGALIWVFGYSMTLLRSIHLGLIVCTGAAAYFLIGSRRDRAMGGAAAVALLWLYQSSHWPMVRPDIMVAFLVACTLGLSTLAMVRRRWFLWAVAGFTAFAGAFSHMISLAIIPVVYLAALTANRDAEEAGGMVRSVFRDCCMVTLGGGAAFLQFMLAAHFRLGDFIFQLTSYHDQVSPFGGTRLEALARHWEVAFFRVGGGGVWAAGMLAVAIAAGAVVWFFRRGGSGARWRAVALVVPPLSFLVLHLISRMFYLNFHENYSLLIHFGCVWLVFATASAVGGVLAEESATARKVLPPVSYALVAVVAVALAVSTLRDPGYKNSVGRDWVGIRAYVDSVLAEIPSRATVWGNCMYGAQSPDSAQIIHFEDAMHMGAALKFERRRELAPEFMIFGNAEQAKLVISAISKPIGEYINPEVFLGKRYEPIAVVAARPYGVTRIYRQVHDGDSFGADRPSLRMYRHDTGQWAQSLGRPVAADWAPAPGVSFRIPRFFDFRGAAVADGSVSAELPPGDYFLKCTLDVPADARDDGFRLVAATSTPSVDDATPSELGPQFDILFMERGSRTCWLVLRHGGGKAYVSHFGLPDGSRIAEVEAYPVDYHMGKDAFPFGYEPLASIGAAQWEVLAEGGSRTAQDDGRHMVVGDASAFRYQAMSPPITVPPGSDILLRADVRAVEGKVALGVLDARGNWLVPATELQTEMRFESGANETVKLVVANAGGDVRSRFVLGAASVGVVGEDFYADKFIKAAFDPANWRYPDPMDAIWEIRRKWR